MRGRGRQNQPIMAQNQESSTNQRRVLLTSWMSPVTRCWWHSGLFLWSGDVSCQEHKHVTKIKFNFSVWQKCMKWEFQAGERYPQLPQNIFLKEKFTHYFHCLQRFLQFSLHFPEFKGIRFHKWLIFSAKWQMKNMDTKFFNIYYRSIVSLFSHVESAMIETSVECSCGRHGCTGEDSGCRQHSCV